MAACVKKGAFVGDNGQHTRQSEERVMEEDHVVWSLEC